MEQDYLTDAYINGGADGLRLVIEAFSKPLLKYCHSILCDYHDAQDAVQVTFIKAYQSRKSFGGSHNLSAYLHRIAYNSCIDMVRRRKPLFYTKPAKSDDGYIPEEIKTALSALSLLDRAVVYSHVVDETSFSELALIYGKSSETLRKRYERARKKLERLLAEKYPYYAQRKQEETNP